MAKTKKQGEPGYAFHEAARRAHKALAFFRSVFAKPRGAACNPQCGEHECPHYREIQEWERHAREAETARELERIRRLYETRRRIL